MKWLKKWESWEPIGSDSDSKKEELKEKFISIFNDLIDVCVDEIDKLSVDYNDIKVFSSLSINDLELSTSYFIYHLESNDYVSKADIILINDKVNLDGDLIIDIAISYNNSFLSANYSEIIKRMNVLYTDIEFVTMDPYSFEN